jgi:cobalt-zinc-cadmium efflux system protein
VSKIPASAHAHDDDQRAPPHAHSAGGLSLAFFLNVGFALLEVVGGLWTNSLAILADALHDFGDAASIGVAWFLHRVSARKSDATFTYGYRRFSVLGAFITGLVLLVGLVAVISHAIPRLLNPQPVYTPGMMLFAVLGILINGAAVLRLRSGRTLNERIVTWHLVEDVLGWIAVLIGSIVMTFWHVPILDPLLSILISLFVLWNVLRHLKKVLLVFLQTAPRSFDAARFARDAAAMPHVHSVHHTQSWSIDGERHVLSTHLVVDRSATPEQVAQAKRQLRQLLEPYEFEHITIETECMGDECQVTAA